ncbi:MAG TPA: glycoside hydrolase, partial [Planctomycetota bacterium]|nr:glycoside hydrolase [Planctomycetota bacterium]
MAPAKKSAIDTVHVIFKTHLDIGFTDFSAKVVKTYFESFIPKALETAEQLAREGGDARFVWTVGSWLVYEYLEQASPTERRRMERAIRAGQICWLGLPFTTHTELMDRSLFEFALSLAQDLDKRYGKKTIAAKMTDVTGHTIGMVPPMAAAGIEFLHIGINAASAVPKTPPLFDWTLGKDSVRVMVHSTYGGATV